MQELYCTSISHAAFIAGSAAYRWYKRRWLANIAPNPSADGAGFSCVFWITGMCVLKGADALLILASAFRAAPGPRFGAKHLLYSTYQIKTVGTGNRLATHAACTAWLVADAACSSCEHSGGSVDLSIQDKCSLPASSHD